MEDHRQSRERLWKRTKGKSFSERRADLKAKREANSPENRAIKEQEHRQNMLVLQKRVAAMDELTDDTKREIFDHYVRTYEKYRASRHNIPSEDVNVLEKIIGAPTLTVEKKKAVLKSYIFEGKVKDPDIARMLEPEPPETEESGSKKSGDLSWDGLAAEKVE